MIDARFHKKNDALVGFTVSGHAEYDTYGQDIVCASVTSAVQLTANAITEVLEVKATVEVDENEICVRLPEEVDERCTAFMEALYLHLVIFSQDYEGTIKVTLTEV